MTPPGRHDSPGVCGDCGQACFPGSRRCRDCFEGGGRPAELVCRECDAPLLEPAPLCGFCIAEQDLAPAL